MTRILLMALFVGSTLGHTDEGLFDVGQLETNFDQWSLARATYQIVSSNDGMGIGSLVFVSSEGHFLTSRHVLDEFIDRHVKKTGLGLKTGFNDPSRPIVITGRIDDGSALPILRNATTGDWIKSPTLEILALPRRMSLAHLRDVVLGRIDAHPNHWIERFAQRPARVGELIYTLGYPCEARRTYNSHIDTPLGTYRNCDGSEPRVSVGTVLQKRGVLRVLFRGGFLSNANGLRGSSGSATFNADGELVGFLSGAWKGLNWTRYERRANGEAYEPLVPTVHTDLSQTLVRHAPNTCKIFLE